jgi:hypothetical protein
VHIAKVLSVFYWIRRDSRSKGLRIPYDVGLFVFLVWPLPLSWYLIYSRGWEKFVVYGLGYVVCSGSLILLGRLSSLIDCGRYIPGETVTEVVSLLT